MMDLICLILVTITWTLNDVKNEIEKLNINIDANDFIFASNSFFGDLNTNIGFLNMDITNIEQENYEE